MGNQGGDYTVRYDVSQIDPDTKMSYTQMALEGFKHQASQLSGTFTPPSGPNWRSYKLVSTTIPNYKPEKEQDFFDGIDTTLPGIAALAHGDTAFLTAALKDIDQHVMTATFGYLPSNPEKIVPETLTCLRSSWNSCPPHEKLDWSVSRSLLRSVPA